MTNGKVVPCCSLEVKYVGEARTHSTVGEVSKVVMEALQFGFSPKRDPGGKLVLGVGLGSDLPVHFHVLRILQMFGVCLQLCTASLESAVKRV